ncbi:hypothetical protein DEO72_LG4g214 [Vigna unguiculata]|uniref:Uncharacterized protein n=1 Tax=Vigna unguiculata TaxID=3917 RepID=A0A4D6LL78_VIGUN|nr:hypothetical protein DEO72_LG4g214 [Vigna unguiculata]
MMVAKATQRSFELVTADLASRPGAAMVGLNVCENGWRSVGAGVAGDAGLFRRARMVRPWGIQAAGRVEKKEARRRRDGGAMKETRWLVHGGAGGSGPSVVRDGGCGMRGEEEDVAIHWCSSGDGVSDEGATGDGFAAWPVVVERGRGGCEVWRLWSGLVRKREKIEIRVRVLVV